VNGNDVADFQVTLTGTGLGLTAVDFIFYSVIRFLGIGCALDS
jgi:hypothetical protein